MQFHIPRSPCFKHVDGPGGGVGGVVGSGVGGGVGGGPAVVPTTITEDVERMVVDVGVEVVKVEEVVFVAEVVALAASQADINASISWLFASVNR